MLKITIKGLLAAKRRLFTTALAVLLGVAFMPARWAPQPSAIRQRLFATPSTRDDARSRGSLPYLGGHRPRDDASWSPQSPPSLRRGA